MADIVKWLRAEATNTDKIAFVGDRERMSAAADVIEQLENALKYIMQMDIEKAYPVPCARIMQNIAKETLQDHDRT